MHLTDDPGRARRIAVSVVLAIAITAIAAIFATWPRPAAQTREVVVANVLLERAPPTPRATPVPTPTPAPLARATTAAVTERAAPRAERTAGGTSVVRPRVPHPVHPAPAAAALPGNGTGSGFGTAAGDDAGGGAGSGGSGSGAVDADAPCGYVEFIPSEAPRIAGTVSYETIRATVHYPDGHTESHEFPYPWVYSDWMNTDPWSPVNVRKADLTVSAQLPPPGTDTHRYNDVVRYILDHTGPTGRTLLQPCPGTR